MAPAYKFAGRRGLPLIARERPKNVLLCGLEPLAQHVQIEWPSIVSVGRELAHKHGLTGREDLYHVQDDLPDPHAVWSANAILRTPIG